MDGLLPGLKTSFEGVKFPKTVVGVSSDVPVSGHVEDDCAEEIDANNELARTRMTRQVAFMSLNRIGAIKMEGRRRTLCVYEKNPSNSRANL